MEQTIQYHIAYSFWYWEEWHQKISEEGFDSLKDLENDEDMSKFMNNILSHPNTCDVKIVKVTTNYETVKEMNNAPQT